MENFNNHTPIMMLEVGDLKLIIKQILNGQNEDEKSPNSLPKYVYGLKGIAQLFNCSIPTAARIKASGKIDEAISQVGRKIIIDVDKALDLIEKKRLKNNRNK